MSDSVNEHIDEIISKNKKEPFFADEERQPQVAALSTNEDTQKLYDKIEPDIRQQRWFNSGKNAKQKGFSRESPFYENATADYFFFCGFDGVSFEEAQQVLKEKLSQILEQDSTLKESVNELVDLNAPKSTDFLP